MNAYFLARTGDHVPFHLYLTKPIDKPDLSGLTIRTTPVYRAFFEKLGANLVRTAPGEVYTALERGSIDGYGWPVQGILDLGWDEQTKYRVDPGFYQVDVNILVNLDIWNSLDEEQRALLEEAAAWVEEKNTDNLEINQVERQKQAEAGIETIEFTGEDAEVWLKEAQDAGWSVVEGIDKEAADKMRACLTMTN
jgi:TRAP-type C4-dicarboxylate transport system substrate-binding protein